MLEHPAFPLVASLAVAAALITGLRILVARRERAQALARDIPYLESQGLVLRQRFRAVRAFAVEEFEDEGSHYYIELEDGSVLFLSGQYLYDFEPVDSGRCRQARRFPCTEFEILRRKDGLWVLDILCSGEVLEPEIVAPPFGTGEYENCEVPREGEIITGQSYDVLKRERLAAGSRQAG